MRASPLSAKDGGYVRASVTASLLDFLRRYPRIDPEDLVRRAGLDVGHLGNPEILLPVRDFIALFEAAAKETGDAAFGIGFAAQTPLRDLGVLGYLLLHSPNLRTGIRTVCRSVAVQRAGGQLHFDDNGDKVIYISDPTLGPDTQDVERILAMIARFCRGGLQRPDWTPRSVSFAHRAPVDDSVHRAFFRCPIRFNAGENALVIPAPDVLAPLPAADPGLLPVLQKYADDCLRQMPATDFCAGVRRAVVACLQQGGDGNIDDVARSLGKSPRSLQRLLQAEDTSYHALLQETRADLARRYLADDTITVTDAALLLGYADLSAFSRAFRKWTGKSPQTFRREAG